MKKMSPCSYCSYYYSDNDGEREFCHYESLFGDDDGYDPCKDAEDAIKYIEEDEKNDH